MKITGKELETIVGNLYLGFDASGATWNEAVDSFNHILGDDEGFWHVMVDLVESLGYEYVDIFN